MAQNQVEKMDRQTHPFCKLIQGNLKRLSIINRRSFFYIGLFLLYNGSADISGGIKKVYEQNLFTFFLILLRFLERKYTVYLRFFRFEIDFHRPRIT